MQHGDLHCNNIMVDQNQFFKIIDFDSTQKGHAEADIISYFVHFFGFYVTRNYISELNELLNNRTQWLEKIKNYDYLACAKLLKSFDLDSAIKSFMLQRKGWFEENSADPEFSKKFFELYKIYNAKNSI